MKGYQLAFFTQQDRRHGSSLLVEWIVEEARRLGIHGATVVPGAEGFGQHRRIHSARFFELGDQPVEIIMAVTEAEAALFMDRLRAESIRIFYVRTPIEFGVLGDE